VHAQAIADWLLDPDNAPKPLKLAEASVHLPPRSTKWVAVYTGVEPGKQVWKSTGLTNREAALAQARQWEAEARKQRQALGKQPTRATLRVRRSSPGSVPFGPLSQKEVAALLNMSERAVRNVEKRALAKLRKHHLLRALWDEIKMETLETLAASTEDSLTGPEIAALFGLAETPEERLALKRVLKHISGSSPWPAMG
jgi:hypothetical protein